MNLSNVILRDVIASRPSAGVAGRLFFATDTGALYRDNGTSWDTVTAGLPGMSNPMTTSGDIITGGSSGTPQRLAVGSTGNVLTVVAGAPAWAAPSGGSSSAFPGPDAYWQFDDFVSAQTASSLGWQTNGGGGNWYMNNGIVGQNGRPGNRDLQAGSGSWVYHMLGPANAAATAYLSGATSTSILASCEADAQSFETNSGRSGFGWFNNTGGTSPTNAIWFCFDNATNGNNHWWAWIVNAGTVTKTDTGVVAHQAWHKLEINTAGSAVTFKIDGSSVATGTMTADTYTPGFFVYGNSGGQADLGFDWFAMQLNYSR